MTSGNQSEEGFSRLFSLGFPLDMKKEPAVWQQGEPAGLLWECLSEQGVWQPQRSDPLHAAAPTSPLLEK